MSDTNLDKKNVDQVNIEAIHDKDLRIVLGSLGLSESIDNGTLLCKFCSRPIKWDNIGAIFLKKGNVTICCNMVECLNNLKSMG